MNIFQPPQSMSPQPTGPWCGKELGHVLLHAPPEPPYAPIVDCRDVVEVEAESVAYLVAAANGLDASYYSCPYVATWAGSVPGRAPEDVVADVGGRVLRTAHRILDSVDVPGPEDRSPGRGRQPVETHERRHEAAAQGLADGARDAGLGSPARPVDTARSRLIAVMDDAADFYHWHVPSSWVPEYLEGRGLAAAADASSPWRVGHAPASWTGLTDHLREAGYSDATLEQAGLASRARTGHLVDRFRDRLILPITDQGGRVVAFVGRAHPDAGTRTPKYLNSPTTAIYRKGEHLLGVHEARAAFGATPVLVEGPLDALAVWVASPARHTPVAVCGTALTTAQADLVRGLAGGCGRPVVVATDADDAGRAAADVAYRHLTSRGMQAWAADLPPGIDPSELLQQHGPRRLAATLTTGARPLIDDVVAHRISAWSDRLRWVEGRVGALRDIAPYIAALPPDQWARPIAQVVDLTGVETTTALRETAAAAGTPARRGPWPGALRSEAARGATVPFTGTPRRPVVHRSISR